jgi:hypothetical protein
MRAFIASALVVALAPLAGCAAQHGHGSAGLCSVSSKSETQIVVASQLRFATPDESGVSLGFDLDGRVSDASDVESCKRADYVSPTGTPGVDNQFAILWNLLLSLVGDAVDGLIQGAINDGTLLLVFRIEGIDDRTNDSCVNVSLFKGAGHPDLGTDGFLAPSQTFDVAEGTPFTETAGYIEDGVLHAGPFEAIIPIAIFGVVADLELHDGLLEGTFGEDGSLTATIGGGVSDDQIMDVAMMAAEDDHNAAKLLKAIPLLLNGSSDLDRSPDDGKCHQLSTVMSFESVPAYLYADTIDPSL